jgi:cobalt-zinc-cadmium efflux system membrane fusion protein
VRRRIGVTAVVGEDAVLVFGPPAGTEVVTDGAAEMFGVEFGGNK